jgi:dihydrofolate synthase/folylpolyglutamate synthase
LPSGELKEKAGEFSLNGEAYSNVNLALEAALNNASADDLVIVCGSIFLVAEVERSIAQLI